MAERDNRQPIEPRHVAFSQAMVKLAREHGVRDLKAEFYGGKGDLGEMWTRVSMTWHAGRHDAKNKISLRAEAIHHVQEDEGPQP